MGALMLGFFTTNADAANKGMGFTASRVDNPYQTNDSVGYFDMTVKPGQHTNLKVKLYNLTNQELKIAGSVNTSYTSGNGTESYNQLNPYSKDLSTEINQLSSLTGGKQIITLKPKEEKVVSFPLIMPSKPYKGILEGAIYLSQLTDTAKQSNQGNLAIHNKFALQLGVVLRENGSVKPAMQLNTISTGIDQAASFSPAFSANLENTQPAMITNLKIKGQIKQHNRVLYETTRSKLGMAPRSNFNYLVNTKGERLKAGNYQIRIVADANEGHWEFTKNFTITKEQAEKANLHAEKGFNWWWIVLLIILLLLLLWLIIWLKRRKKDEENEDDLY